jgi:hypothetical protein
VFAGRLSAHDGIDRVRATAVLALGRAARITSLLVPVSQLLHMEPACVVVLDRGWRAHDVALVDATYADVRFR